MPLYIHCRYSFADGQSGTFHCLNIVNKIAGHMSIHYLLKFLLYTRTGKREEVDWGTGEGRGLMGLSGSWDPGKGKSFEM